MEYINRYEKYLTDNDINKLVKTGEIDFDEADSIVFKPTRKRCIGCNEFLGDKYEGVECPQCEKDSKEAFRREQEREEYNGTL